MPVALSVLALRNESSATADDFDLPGEPKSKEVYMDDEVVKIAERTFTRTMRNCSLFADIGIELKKIQFELRGIARRANAVERFIGIPVSQPRESTDEDNQTRLLSSDIKYLTGDELKRIRLQKNLKISQMAELLKVSHRKYVEWERGNFLMVPWVQEEILRISKIHARDLQAAFKKEREESACLSQPVHTRKAKHISAKEIPRDNVNRVCRGLKISQRLLAIKLGITYSKMRNWSNGRAPLSDDTLKKFNELLLLVKDIPAEQIKEKSHQHHRQNSECIISPEEIRGIREKLHWTRRALALYLGINKKETSIFYWERGITKPSPPLAEKIRLLLLKIKSGELKPEYEGPLATVDEIRFLQRKLNYGRKRMSEELHIQPATLTEIYSGRLKVSYRITSEVRNLQKKFASGEIQPEAELGRFPGSFIRDLCIAYRYQRFNLARAIGCSVHSLRMWETEQRRPWPEFNKKLWDLWNNAPKDKIEHIMGEKIYKFRRSLLLTQKQFAERIGVIQITISRWERNLGGPSVKLIDRIHAAFPEFRNFK